MYRNRKKRDLTWQEILYGLMVIGLIIWMLIDTAINGRGGNPTDNW